MAEWARRTWWHEGPLSSVWLGTSITNQADADERIPHLLQTPAAVRWLSAEPLLGPVDIKFWLRARFGRLGFGEYGQLVEAERPVRRLHWVVIGARTGPSGSIPETSWVRNIIEDCRETETPVFVKDNVAWPERIRQFPRLEG
jgi:protein gp37